MADASKQSVDFVQENNHCFFSEIHTEHVNKLCGHKLEILNVKDDGSQSTKVLSYKGIIKYSLVAIFYCGLFIKSCIQWAP